MKPPTTCPECGSPEVRETERRLVDATMARLFVCDVCHWVSDPRSGRPPADRGKNVTLRRLITDARSSRGTDDEPRTGA